MGPGKSYTGVLGTIRTADGYWSQDYMGQETWLRDWGLYLRGPADDIMLCHYGACDICRASVMHFASRPQQPSFTYANDGAGPVRNNHITDKRN